MTGLSKQIHDYGSELNKEEQGVIHRLISDWQILADLALADLILWTKTAEGNFVALAHCRPATGATIHLSDVVGLYASVTRSEKLKVAWEKAVPSAEELMRWVGSYSVLDSWIPVKYQGKVIALISLEVNSQSLRGSESQLQWFKKMAGILAEMITNELFPNMTVASATMHGVPRVTDGVVLIDSEGKVLDLSPNAQSALRRLGIRSTLRRSLLAPLVTEVVADQSSVDEALPVVLMGKAPWITEVASPNGTLSLRAIPLWQNGVRFGAILLCRDVTEMRRREQELITKDATIREIHHRVKNNLQTVAALLRMQSRRSDSDAVKAALREAGRRVAMIAKVHEELSQTVAEEIDFDSMIDRLTAMSAAMATMTGQVRTKITGKFGILGAEVASALAVIISELVTNAVEHAFPEDDENKTGLIEINAERAADKLVIRVIDNGCGLARSEVEKSTAKISTGLGTSIVKTLVRGELNGTIEWRTPETGGTEVVIKASLDPKKTQNE